MQPVDTTTRCREEWKSASVVNSVYVTLRISDNQDSAFPDVSGQVDVSALDKVIVEHVSRGGLVGVAWGQASSD